MFLRNSENCYSAFPSSCNSVQKADVKYWPIRSAMCSTYTCPTANESDWSLSTSTFWTGVARTWENAVAPRRGTIIPHYFCAYQSASSWVCPCIVAVLKLKKTVGSFRDHQRKRWSFHRHSHSRSFRVGIPRDHPWKWPSKFHYYVKSKSMGIVQQFTWSFHTSSG